MDSIKYEVTSDKPFDAAIAALIKSLAEEKFGVLWQMDFKEKLREKGLEFDGQAVILEACNPQFARDVLSRHIEMAYFLPCKLVVYARDGKTRIGMLSPTVLVGLMQHADIEDIARAVEGHLTAAIDRAR